MHTFNDLFSLLLVYKDFNKNNSVVNITCMWYFRILSRKVELISLKANTLFLVCESDYKIKTYVYSIWRIPSGRWLTKTSCPLLFLFLYLLCSLVLQTFTHLARYVFWSQLTSCLQYTLWIFEVLFPFHVP